MRPVSPPHGALSCAAALLATASAFAEGHAETTWSWGTWAGVTASPQPLEPIPSGNRDADLQRACGRGDAGLLAVARRLVDRKLHDLPYLEADGLGALQRMTGEPHVWPRAFIVSGKGLDPDTTRRKLVAWGATFREPGERRCGVATGHGADGVEVVAVVAVDAAADLAPLPTQTRVGAWLSVDARLRVPAAGASVVVMGPTGRPRTVPTHLEGDRVRAQIALDQPGAFTVQVVAELASGPRPVLEAALFAEVTPWLEPPDLRAPGETAVPVASSGGDAASDRAALLAMVAALRASEQLPPLTPDPRLETLGLAHAARMQAARTVAHDLGDGDPLRRFEAAGLAVRTAGENVAHAASVGLAHRALYASPSHRANLLSPAFERVGIAVLRDPDGSVWVTEELAGGLR